MKKLRHNIYLILLTIPLLIVAFYGLKKTPDTLPVFSAKSSYGTENISVYDAKDGNLYVFLPSYADMAEVTVSSAGNSVFLEKTRLSAGMDCSIFQQKTPYPLIINNKKVGNLWFYQSASTAAIHIDTASESMEKIHANKNTAEQSNIRVFTSDGFLNYHGPHSTIKGRGNSSWTREKKPYTITLEQSNNLLNLGTSSKWVLLANYTDETNLRNKLVFDYATAVSNYPGFSPACTFVDLYLNSEYAGLYLLCQKIEVSSDFLDLSANDCLMELMFSSRNTQSSATFEVCPTRAVEVIYPANCTNSQIDTLQIYMSEFQEALFSESGICKASGKKWSDYIDLDSWARKYLVEEIFSNFDVGQASQFFWLNSADNKLYAGPCWDYDLTLGKQWLIQWHSPYSLFARRAWEENESWYGALWNKEEFRNYVISLYSEKFRPPLAALPDQTVPDMASRITNSACMDRIRWGKPDTYQESVNQIISYLDTRIAFLDALWLENKPFCAVTIQASETLNIYVPHNTVCSTLPQPEDLRTTGIWYDKKTGEPFDASAPICQDIVLVAKNPNPTDSNKEFSFTAKEAVIILSVAVIFVLFLCLTIADFCQRRKERRNANEQSRS